MKMSISNVERSSVNSNKITPDVGYQIGTAPVKKRYPYSIVWTPIPFLTWFCPVLGHMGITMSSGVIRDFAGPYFVSEDNMAFGSPTKFLQLNPALAVGDSDGWDRAVTEASNEYSTRMHNLCGDNCHSHVAMALNKMNYNSSSWNSVKLAFLMCLKGRYVSCGGILRTWLPFFVMMIATLSTLKFRRLSGITFSKTEKAGPTSTETAPIRVCITGAAGQLAYCLIFQVSRGDVFGPNQPMILTLLDIPDMMGVLGGVVMEVVDCALPLVQQIIPTDDPAVAFKDIDAAFLVGSVPRKAGMERKDLLSGNVNIFKVQGQALNEYAKKTAKIVVVGNPANTNTMVCAKFAPDIPPENFSAMTRLDQNRAQAQIAQRLNVRADKVKNVISWGNHSATLYPDVANGTVVMGEGPVSIEAAVKDNEWLSTEFVQIVRKRGGEVIAARKLSSAMSAAKAASDQMRDIWNGTKPGEYISLGVISDGSYGIPKDIVFSFPVTIKNKQWNIVKNLNVSAFAQEKLTLSAKELEDEREEALSICGKS